MCPIPDRLTPLECWPGQDTIQDRETAAKGETTTQTEVSRDHVLPVVVLRHFLADVIKVTP